MNPTNPKFRFRFYVEGLSLSHAEWSGEDDIVIYHHGSGDTHLVTEEGFRILKYIKDTPRTMREITMFLNEDSGLEREPFSLQDLEQRYLVPFYKLGLIKYFAE